MRKLTQQIRTSVVALALVAALATPAAAGSLYRFVTDEGTVSFTDDSKRIPARYRASADRLAVARLADYARYTPEDGDASTRYAERLHARVERLRELNRALAYELPLASHAAAPGYETVLRANSRAAVRVQNPVGEEPVVLEEHRVLAPGGMVTRHVTIVRQGDRVLSVIRPQSSLQPLSWPDESELVR